MSLQSLISGTECATTSNPLTQMLKHADTDRSVQRDRVNGPSSSRLHHLPLSTTAPNPADVAMARKFFDSGSGPSNIQEFKPMLPQQLLANLHNSSGPAAFHTPDVELNLKARPLATPQPLVATSSTWSDEYEQIPVAMAGPSMAPFPNHVSRNALMHESMRMNATAFQPHLQPLLSMGMPAVNWDQEFSRLDPKGKGKHIDADFEEAFTRAAASVAKEKSRIVEVQDETETLGAALERARLSDSPQSGAEAESTDYISDFQKVWDRLKNSEAPPPTDDLAKWEAEYNQILQAQRDDLNFGDDFEDAWLNGSGDISDNFPSMNLDKFDDEGLPILEPYKFEPNNPYVDEPGSHLARAKALLDQNGSLTEAALLLEAAILKEEFGEGGYETWILLGETRSMDEREDAAMRALTEGVRRARLAGNDGEGMLSLAISYTNESYDRATHTMLHQWLLAKFQPLVPEHLRGPLPRSAWASHDLVTDAYLAVAREQHLRNEMDPEVQIGLGVLFYTHVEFDKAKDCFESALAARPKDYLLWNRLGSCLSNGLKPEEALEVYRQALQLRPTYTRAIYNVGVACLNIGAFKEAAEHFLSALLMQDSARGDKSEQLWQTLRKCFASMDRNDLAEIAKSGQDLNRFREEGFDF